jgi:hypothetical protein
MTNKPRKKIMIYLGLSGLLMIVFILAIGLWPLDYRQSNSLSWDSESPGLHFSRRSLAYARGETVRWPPPPDNGWSAELYLEPLRTFERGIGQILTLCDQKGWEFMFVGQWRNGLILRVMEESVMGKKRVTEAYFRDILNPGKVKLITLIFSEGTVRLFMDGEFRGERDFYIPDRPHYSLGLLVLGNAANGKSSWTGFVRGIALLSRPLDASEVFIRSRMWATPVGELSEEDTTQVLYNFEYDQNRSIVTNRAGDDWSMQIPETFIPPRRDVLVPPWKDFRFQSFYLKDMIVNLLGFIPLGVLAAIFIMTVKSSASWPVCFFVSSLAGGSLSLFIEINQVFILSRSSSLMDLILNTFGTGLGALSVPLYLHYYPDFLTNSGTTPQQSGGCDFIDS